MADGDALHITRTKVLSVVEIQKVLKRRLFYQLFSTLCNHKLIRVDKHQRLEVLKRTSSLLKHKQLLEFDFRASVFELLLGGFSVSFWDAFFDVLWSAVNQIFGFFKA
jgi:hypothetical protein